MISILTSPRIPGNPNLRFLISFLLLFQNNHSELRVNYIPHWKVLSSITLQIFWLQKLQLLVVFTVQLQSGCDFCNYELKQILAAKIATRSCSYHWLLFLQPVVEVTFGCLFCNRWLQYGLDSKISTNSCNNLFLTFPVFYTPVILFFHSI